MDDDQDVRLEFVASVEIDAQRIVRFVQELKEIPAEAWCEVQNVWSKADGKAVTTTAQMRCERRVADFLCQHFSKQVRHVSQGELLLVMCRRVFTRTLPTGSSTTRNQPSKQSREKHQGATQNDAVISEKADEKRTPALSRSTMIDLLDCLGDDIVDVLDAFQAHAMHSNSKPRLTMIGVVQALSQLRKKEWSTNANPRPLATGSEAKNNRKGARDPSSDRLAVEKVRYLLKQLIDHGMISTTSLPGTNESPFLSYTDFIACYVAFMNSSSASDGRGTTSLIVNVTAKCIVLVDSKGGEIGDLPSMMNDTFGLSMEMASSSRSGTMKQLRKPKRTTRSVETPGPELGDVFLGVAEMGSLDGIIGSQRSESDERVRGRSSGQSHRSRGSKSTGNGLKMPQGSVSKRETLTGMQTLGGEDLSLRESTTLARQQLTSSASRVRPSKQQPSQQQQSTRGARPTTRQVNQAHTPQRDTIKGRSLARSNNNNEDEDEPIVEEEGSVASRRAVREGGTSHHLRGASEWEVLYGVNQAGQLPSRIQRYLNVSAASDGVVDESPLPQQDEEDSPLSEIHHDRPPSRQCHAFPTHLLDARDFFSPAKQHDGATAISITPWHADEDDDDRRSTTSISPEEDPSQTKQSKSDVRQRPPSRYMTKVPRGDTSSSSTPSTTTDEPQVVSSSSGRLPSRRGAAGQWNQAAQYHHDPKTDGFADLDERVPPPFRVEITTESARSQYVPSDHRRADEERRHSLKSRRASSFGSRSQLNKLQQTQAIYGIIDQEAGLRDRGVSKRAASTRQSKVLSEPEWLAKEQESNPVVGLMVDVPHPPALNHSKRSIREPGAMRIDNNSSSSSTTTSSSSNNNPGAAHQWFRASNNPFFLTPAAPPVAAEFDEMDADTAIANTPLFAEDGDLMAMAQLSDLHLDDFMGDPYISAPPVGAASVSVPRTTIDMGAAKTPTPTEPGSKKLNTSLGKDFLSLFAQH